MSTSSTTPAPEPSSGSSGTAFEDLPDRKTIKKAIAASAMGNATEWYDYGVYSVVALYISDIFFVGPHATLWTMLTLAVSFLARPFGGFFWGPLGDRVGRKGVLAMTIVMMSGATFCIGLLPSYETIGIFAPILLILLRLIQGFSTGGEYAGAATFMAEYAPDKRRGMYGSFLEFGTLGGYALGAAVVLILEVFLGEGVMADWGWRIPFFVAGPLGAIGLYMRSKLEETPVYQDLEDAGESEESATGGLRDLLVEYWKPILVMAGMVIPVNVVNYTLLVYMPTYLQTKLDMAEKPSLVVIIVGELLMMCLLPWCGRYSDIIGRKPMWWFSLITLFIFALPMYYLIGTGFTGAVIGFAVLGLLYIPQLSTISATFPAIFPAHVRFAGFAVTYNVFTSAFGGTAAPINEAVVDGTGFIQFPAAYMMLACAIGMVSVLFLKETAGASLNGTDIPEASPEDYSAEALLAETKALDAAGR